MVKGASHDSSRVLGERQTACSLQLLLEAGEGRKGWAAACVSRGVDQCRTGGRGGRHAERKNTTKASNTWQVGGVVASEKDTLHVHSLYTVSCVSFGFQAGWAGG